MTSGDDRVVETGPAEDAAPRPVPRPPRIRHARPSRQPRVRATTSAPAFAWCLTCPSTVWLGADSIRLARAHVQATGHRAELGVASRHARRRHDDVAIEPAADRRAAVR